MYLEHHLRSDGRQTDCIRRYTPDDQEMESGGSGATVRRVKVVVIAHAFPGDEICTRTQLWIDWQRGESKWDAG